MHRNDDGSEASSSVSKMMPVSTGKCFRSTYLYTLHDMNAAQTQNVICMAMLAKRRMAAMRISIQPLPLAHQTCQVATPTEWSIRGLKLHSFAWQTFGSLAGPCYPGRKVQGPNPSNSLECNCQSQRTSGLLPPWPVRFLRQFTSGARGFPRTKQ